MLTTSRRNVTTAQRAVARLSILLLDSFGVLYDEQFHARILLVHAACEIAWPIFEQHHEAKSEDDEQEQPTQPAQNRHATG